MQSERSTHENPEAELSERAYINRCCIIYIYILGHLADGFV